MNLSQATLDTIARLDQENKERKELMSHIKNLNPSLERRGGPRAGAGRKKVYQSPEGRKEIRRRRSRNAAQKRRLEALLAAQLRLEESTEASAAEIISVTHANLIEPSI